MEGDGVAARLERATDAKNSTREGCPRVKEPRVGRGRREDEEAPGKLRVSNHRRILWDHNCARRVARRWRTIEVLKDSLSLRLLHSLSLRRCTTTSLFILSLLRVRSNAGC